VIDTGWKEDPGDCKPPNPDALDATALTPSDRSAVLLASAIRTRSWTCWTPASRVRSAHFTPASVMNLLIAAPTSTLAIVPRTATVPWRSSTVTFGLNSRCSVSCSSSTFGRTCAA